VNEDSILSLRLVQMNNFWHPQFTCFVRCNGKDILLFCDCGNDPVVEVACPGHRLPTGIAYSVSLGNNRPVALLQNECGAEIITIGSGGVCGVQWA
jgi:hypothetical protein